MNLMDNITDEALVKMGFEKTSEDTFEFKKTYPSIKLIKNKKNGYDLYKNDNILIHSGLCNYWSIKLFLGSDLDFFRYFKGFEETENFKYNKLQYHSETTNKKLLTWIHNNSDKISQIISISECSSDSTVWYYE